MQMNKRYADEIHSALLSGIVDGRFPPGEVLNEIPLAEEFGVSRTPVREALQRLKAEGMVERGARRAVVVRKMDSKTLHALFEAMGELEALVTRFAALRMSELERQALHDIVEAGEDPGADYAQINDRFHGALRAGAHNPVLAGLLADMDLRTMPWRRAQFRKRAERIRSSQAEHRAILEAILNQDANEAHRLMRGHAAASLRTVIEILGSQGPDVQTKATAL